MITSGFCVSFSPLALFFQTFIFIVWLQFMILVGVLIQGRMWPGFPHQPHTKRGNHFPSFNSNPDHGKPQSEKSLKPGSAFCGPFEKMKWKVKGERTPARQNYIRHIIMEGAKEFPKHKWWGTWWSFPIIHRVFQVSLHQLDNTL